MNRLQLYIPNFSYNNSKKILNEINFEVKEGKVNFLVGHNGSGKTTLIDLFLGLTETKNSIKDYTINNDYIYINQLLPMLENVDCKELISLILGIIYHKSVDLNFIKEKVSTDIYYIFENFWEKKYNELSLGEKKILQIFSFIQSEKKIVVLDEPTAFIDRYYVNVMFDFINASPQKTFIIITHDDRDLRLVDDYYITFIDSGYIMAFENKESFETKNNTEGFLKYFNTHNSENSLRIK